jgi:hypothetical protein
MRLDVATDGGPGDAGELATVPGIALCATALASVRVGVCAVELRARCDDPPSIVDRSLAWRALGAETVTPELSPLVLRWRDPTGGPLELRAERGGVACRAAWRDGVLRLAVHLDAAALHPRWSFAGGRTTCESAPPWPAGRRETVRLTLRRIAADAAAPVLLGRLPAGAEAALTITDHCDFDTVDRLRAFTVGDGAHAGWAGRGLRITKGVFALPSASRGRTLAPTLADAGYRATVERLHDDGSEIAPHGVNESGDPGVAAFAGALAAIARDFAPRTWIDHGLTLPYCYTMGGAHHPEYALLRRLADHGITTLWSYHDAPTDAAASLDALAPADGDLGARTRSAAHHLRRGRPMVAAHYARSALRARLHGPVGDAVGRALSATRALLVDEARRPVATRTRRLARELAGVGRALVAPDATAGGAAEPHTRAELLALAPLLYPERGAPLGRATLDEPLLFATTEVLHTQDAYTPAALARLVEARGVHVGHCYLLNRLPYIAGLFADGGGGARIGRAWDAFVDALAAGVRDGRVWNPTMGELAGWLRAMQHVSLTQRAACAVALRHALPHALADVTLLLPADVSPADVRWDGRAPAGSRRWADHLAVWGALPPARPVVVRWG